MSDRENEQTVRGIVHLVNDSIISDPNAIQIGRTGQFDTARWTSVLLQAVNRFAEAPVKRCISQRLKRFSPRRLRSTEFRIQPSFHWCPMNRFFRFGQGVARRFQIGCVLQRFEFSKILNKRKYLLGPSIRKMFQLQQGFREVGFAHGARLTNAALKRRKCITARRTEDGEPRTEDGGCWFFKVRK